MRDGLHFFGLLMLPAELFDHFFGMRWGAIARTTIQFELMLLSLIMLSRLVSNKPYVRIFTMLIFAFSFPTTNLAIISERRLLALSFLIIAIYHVMTNKNKPGENKLWLSIAAGSVICNAYVALMAIRSKKTFIKDLLVCGGVFVFVTSLLGKIGGLFNSTGACSTGSEWVCSYWQSAASL
ncbi:MAG: hypothetical protein FWH07_07185 [Oscillospiraceae bacterium]|nr:hypothetical protein [Oscillospiraceae bacterium]